jgi:2-methylisocitrate lyase-like PEP mutase family enzyme
MTALRSLLARPDIIVAPGCYDALTALLIEQAGFPALYLSGASLNYTRFGGPDIGLTGLTEAAETVGIIADRVALPLIVDCDTGFGNALNVQRTVQLMARNGAAAVQLEDQASPKRCGHLAGKRLIPAVEMVGKIKAALDARRDDDLLIIARTDAVAVEGFEAALDRAEAYVAAGAEMLLVEAPRNDAELATIARRFRERIPLMANMVEGGVTPIKDAAQLEALGFSLVIFPGGTVRALVPALRSYFASLRQHGTTAPYRDRMIDLKEINEIVGTPDMLARGRRYDAESH